MGMQEMFDTLKKAAYEYRKIGCNVILLADKKPLHEWQKWIKERQTQAEFESLPWNKANQFGLVCGTKLENGFYLAVLDHDVKNLPEETVSKGKKLLKSFPITQLEETPSGGLHLIYYSRNELKSISAYHNDCALELIGVGKLCIMAPSQGYKNLNDNTPTETLDIEKLFHENMIKAGIEQEKRKTEAWFDRQDLLGAPYKKATPLCIREILKGTSEGNRSEWTIRLGSYLVNFKQLTQNKAYKQLVEWNALNRSPLNESELKTIFESAIKGRYVFGCDDEILKSFCNENAECLLRKKDVKKEIEKKHETEKVTYDPETEAQIEREVQKIVDADNQLEALQPYLDVMIVGEINTKKCLVVLLSSAKLPNPESKQIVILKAESGAGKTTLMRNASQGYRVKNVGRFSAHALDYSNLADFEILSLKELGSMDEEKQGISTIKFLSSDDMGYTVEITVKDEETGKFTTEQRTIPPITVVSSTTRLVLDPQFERRAWPLGLDETSEQTKKIAEWYATQEIEKSEKMLGLKKLTSYEFSGAVYSRFIERFQPRNIIVPFPHQLVRLLGYDALRVRGDIGKLLIFVKLYGNFNLKRLQKIRDVYIASPQVAIEALSIVLEPLVAMLSRIDKRSKQLFEILRSIKHVEQVHAEDQHAGFVEKEITYNEKGNKIDRTTREEIAVKIGKSERIVRRFFNQLETGGYVSSDRKSKSKVFTLLYDVDDIEKKFNGISDKLKTSENLMLEMEKEAQEWLRSHLDKISLTDGEKIISDACAPDNHTENIFHASTEQSLTRCHLDDNQTALTKMGNQIRSIQKCPDIQQKKEEVE
jgi:hypothetical protein